MTNPSEHDAASLPLVMDVTDKDVLDSASSIEALYERLRDLQSNEPPRKHVQTSGGVCRGCSGWTTYTRQNSEKGLCMKCEGEGIE